MQHQLSNGTEAISSLHFTDKSKILISRTEFWFGNGRSYRGDFPLYMEIDFSYPYDLLPASPEDVLIHRDRKPQVAICLQDKARRTARGQPGRAADPAEAGGDRGLA